MGKPNSYVCLLLVGVFFWQKVVVFLRVCLCEVWLEADCVKALLTSWWLSNTLPIKHPSKSTLSSNSCLCTWNSGSIYPFEEIWGSFQVQGVVLYRGNKRGAVCVISPSIECRRTGYFRYLCWLQTEEFSAPKYYCSYRTWNYYCVVSFTNVW